MNNRVLSIEIGNSFTKICEIDYKVKKPKVYKVLTVETPEGVVVDGMLQPTQEYADHLVNALGTNGIRTKKVIFTISSTRVASREVQIPNVKANKIEALVKTNANDYFPVDLTQYEIGHYLAGGLTEDGKLRVMALAVPKALLNSYSQLAQMCGLSYSYFAKLFRETYNQSCKEYIEFTRINKATDLLLFTNQDLTYISQETGFADCSHLIRTFKKWKGMTPKQWKKTLK